MSGLASKALAETVLGGLINLGLGIRNCCGQGYDGVAFLDILMGYLHIFIKLIVKWYMHMA